MKKMKTYAITLENNGSVLNQASSKKEALIKFIEQGYKVSLKDVYLY